jgi:hypothetical protein
MNTHDKLIALIEALQIYFIQRANDGDDLAARLANELSEMLTED